MTILFVDRGKTFEYLKPVLEQMADIAVVHRETADEALAYLRNHEEVDCIITSIDLPDFTGILLAEQVRQVDSVIPIIIFTHYKNNAIIEGIKSVNATFWDKSFILAQPDLLKVKLGEVLRRTENLSIFDSKNIYSKKRLKRFNSLAFPAVLTSSEN